MSDAKTVTSARVRLEIEIPLGGGGWGGDCSMKQVNDQAREEARNAVERIFQAAGWRAVSVEIVAVIATTMERKP